MKRILFFLFILLSLHSIAQPEISKRDSGKCYAMCIAPFVYRYDSVVAIVQPQHKKFVTVPASYFVSVDTVQYAAGDSVNKNVPGIYDVTEEKILISPAKKIWVVVGTDTTCHSQFPEDCEIKEPRTVEAKYKVLTQYIVYADAGNATTQSERKYKEVTVYEIADAPSKKKMQFPATYTTIVTKTLTSNPHEELETEMLCPEKISLEVIAQVEQKLRESGFETDNFLNELGETTNSSLEKFQQLHQLPVGGLNMETVRYLGIDY